jgi:RHS repeat-associated protein
MTLRSLTAVAALSLLWTARAAHATEICGNDLDDDGNGVADEGCAPSLTTGVCESPLSCGDTGMVSWSTGSLHYDLPPDAAPNVPWGPGIGFRRFYTSAYAPGTAPASVNHTPLGARWQHTYLSFVDRYQVGGVWKVVLHTSEGRDVYASLTSTVGGWEYYTPQAGFHVMSIKRNTASPNQYQVQLLTGETLYYNSVGQLAQIWDSLPTPNKVLVTWTSTSNGNVSTVTDAAGKRRLLFNYTSGLMSSLNYQVLISGTWTTEQTTTYTYTSGTLTSVSIGAGHTQQYTYTGGYLTSITDASGNLIAGFTYDGTTASQVDRVDTPEGMVGLEYNSSRTACSGDTVLYFNRATTASCTTDADCGGGQYLCGGKTGSGATGTCFLAGRCLALSTVNSEPVVSTVTPLGRNNKPCDGACAEVAQYVWSGGAGLLDVIGRADPLGNYTSATYDVNGMPTQITYGDNDSDPTTVPSGARTTYLFYDTTYPGRIAEMRRNSDLAAPPIGCSASNTSGCARTIYTYGADTQLQQLQQTGLTLDSTGASVAFTYTTAYTHDTKGRLTEVDGPVTGMKTIFDFFTSTDPMKDGYLQDYKIYKDATNHLDTSVIAYDFWGNVTGRQDPDGTVSCRTFDISRNYLTQTREAMAGQTDCSTPNSVDLTTSWVRDSALRVTQVTRPDGGCVFMLYDTRGRLSEIRRRDDCNQSSSGDSQTFTYDTEGLLTEIDTKDAAGAITAKQPYTYYDSRRLHTIVNPVKTSVSKALVYDARGMVAELDDESGLGKTTYSINADSRITAEQRYKTSSTYDQWTLSYDWLGDQSKVTDGDSKTTQSVRDDLGRYVKLVSPDLSYPIVKVFDAAGELTTQIDALGLPGHPATAHTFTFDDAGRPLNDDYYGTCSVGTQHPEIQRAYDGMPSGVTCPLGNGCNNLNGRLAYVKVTLLCSSAYTDDGALDQETFYSYDAAGRLVEEYIRDDSGRTADHAYAWNKDGQLTQVTTPSGAVIGWTFDSTGSNSDLDRITALWQTSTSTPVATSIQWFPFGPLKQYTQQNAIGGTAMQTVVQRNLAYRISNLEVETGATERDGVAVTEDDKGRVTLRDYFDNSSGVSDSYFLYDEQDRVLCETTNLVASCPTTAGSTIKNSHSASPPFTNAGDWKLVLRNNNGSPGSDTFSLNTGTHQISQVYQDATLGGVSYTYDAIGNRSSDAGSGSLETHTGRSYTYDGRHNVVNVREQYPIRCFPFCGWTWHYADVSSAFDAKGRRVFKGEYDENSGLTRNYFYYYDALDRLTEFRYIPDISNPSSYSIFQIAWLGHRPVAYTQTDYPGPTVSKRYTVSDEMDRIIAMWSWPATGDATKVWAINPDAWAADKIVTGASILQPLVFAGQYQDWDTYTYSNDANATMHEYALSLNGTRTYDPFAGAYLQVDPEAEQSRSSYVYAGSDPVDGIDPQGNMYMTCHGHDNECTTEDDGTSCSQGTYEYDCPDGDTGDQNGQDIPLPHPHDPDGPAGPAGPIQHQKPADHVANPGASIWPICVPPADYLQRHDGQSAITAILCRLTGDCGTRQGVSACARCMQPCTDVFDSEIDKCDDPTSGLNQVFSSCRVCQSAARKQERSCITDCALGPACLRGQDAWAMHPEATSGTPM